MTDNGTIKNSSVKAALGTVSEGRPEIYTLSTGVRVKLQPVNSMLIQAAMGRIKDPPVPIVVDEQQGREYSNPTDPAYLRELEEAAKERGYARLNTVILWGVELADGLPDDDKWLYKLKFQEKQGDIDLSDFDFDNPIDKEFAYKKFVSIGDKVDKNGMNSDLSLILNHGMVSEEGVDEAHDVFPGSETQSADSQRPAQEPEVVSE